MLPPISLAALLESPTHSATTISTPCSEPSLTRRGLKTVMTYRLMRIANAQALSKDAMTVFIALDIRIPFAILEYDIAEKPAMIAMMMMTTINSMSVKPKL